jgi:hypothetical protein
MEDRVKTSAGTYAEEAERVRSLFSSELRSAKDSLELANAMAADAHVRMKKSIAVSAEADAWVEAAKAKLELASKDLELIHKDKKLASLRARLALRAAADELPKSGMDREAADRLINAIAAKHMGSSGPGGGSPSSARG